MLDLKERPLGLGDGEGTLQQPFNARPVNAQVFLINHSATQTRKFVKLAVSERRGADEALLADKELTKIYNVETLSRAAGRRDMNVYVSKVQPVVYRVIFDSQPFYITYAKGESDPPRCLVPEGVWDQFMGNYERMHSDDPRVVSEEAQRLALLWQGRHNPILRITENGETTTRDNPYGYLEIVRIVQTEAPQSLDRDFVTAADFLETA